MNTNTGCGLVFFILWAVLAVGWIINIFKVVGLESLDSGLAILRIVGIFIPPLGGIVGWI